MHPGRFTLRRLARNFKQRRPAYGLRMVALSVALVLVAGTVRADGGKAAQERTKAVYLLYQLTDGAQEICDQAPSEAVKEPRQAVATFIERHPNLMKLIRESDDYAASQARFREVRHYPEVEPPELQCKGSAWLLQVFEGPRGQEDIRKYEAILSGSNVEDAQPCCHP